MKDDPLCGRSTRAASRPKTPWGAFRLPLDLDFIGIPGCKLLVSPDLLYLVQNVSGTALWSMTLPSDPGMPGITFFNQAWVVDAPANALGVSVTNAGEGRIGAR